MVRAIWSKIILPRFEEWKQSDRSILGWAILTGFFAGVLAVILKRAVFGLQEGMFGLGEWMKASWFLGTGPLLGLFATRWVIKSGCEVNTPGQEFRVFCTPFHNVEVASSERGCMLHY